MTWPRTTQLTAPLPHTVDSVGIVTPARPSQARVDGRGRPGQVSSAALRTTSPAVVDGRRPGWSRRRPSVRRSCRSSRPTTEDADLIRLAPLADAAEVLRPGAANASCAGRRASPSCSDSRCAEAPPRRPPRTPRHCTTSAPAAARAVPLAAQNRLSTARRERASSARPNTARPPKWAYGQADGRRRVQSQERPHDWHTAGRHGRSRFGGAVLFGMG
jgi:hypothetical protein